MLDPPGHRAQPDLKEPLEIPDLLVVLVLKERKAHKEYKEYRGRLEIQGLKARLVLLGSPGR